MKSTPPSVTDQLFADHIRCKYKAYLRLTNQAPEVSEHSKLVALLNDEYAKSVRGRLIHKHTNASTSSAAVFRPSDLEGKDDLVFGPRLISGDCISRPDALCRTPQARSSVTGYTPLRFVRSHRLTRLDKLLVAYDAFLLASLQATTPAASIIYSSRLHRAVIPVPPLLPTVRKVVADLHSLSAKLVEPMHVLNKHCQICEFRAHCWQQALDRDHPSLLQGMTETEIERQGKKGIFTVSQMSYTFRARKPRKRAQHPGNPHHFSLQALALREGKVFIHGTPNISSSDNCVYFDIEGVPDRDFYYLIGALIVEDGVSSYCHYWADTEADQASIFCKFVDRMAACSGWPRFHFGHYDALALKHMRPHLGAERASTLDALLSDCTNVVSVIHPHVYFPVYRNSLKDIGQFLGHSWVSKGATGQSSVCWRYEWEAQRGRRVKERLIQYNRDDCEALRRVVEFICRACGHASLQSVPVGDGDIIHTDSLKERVPKRHKFGKAEFVFDDWSYINKCAYFDYQRQHVFVRTDKNFRAINRRHMPRNGTQQCKPTAKIEFTCKKCPQCRSRKIGSQSPLRRRLIDLRFSSTGVRRWVGDIAIWRYKCRKCDSTIVAPEAPSLVSKFGRGLMSWCIYQHLVCGQNMLQVRKGLRDVFGLHLSYPQLYRFKALAANIYRDTYKAIQEEIVGSTVIHIDETTVNLRKRTGYVWVITSKYSVWYLYRESREAGFLADLLREFSGVLVSDFFMGYDSLECAQQKCLIHLMRDINEDLLRNPFDEKLADFANRFGSLLRRIVETIDRYGLRRRNLQKHKKEASRFVESVCVAEPASPALVRYQKRFRRSGRKMFTFLEHDGVPWNNNNAEHAVKAFARCRRFSDGRFTEKSLGDFLLLLSVFQSCEYNNINVLGFLLSGETAHPNKIGATQRSNGRNSLVDCHEGCVGSQPAR